MAWAVDVSMPISTPATSGISGATIKPSIWSGGAGPRGIMNYFALAGSQINGGSKTWLWIGLGLAAGFLVWWWLKRK